MISIQKTTLFLLFALGLSPVTILSASSLLEELGLTGNIIGREFVYVGDELQLTCVLDSNEFTASNITFTVYYPFESNDTRKCINQQQVYVINDSTAVLSVPNVSRAGRAEYSCLVASECINNMPSSSGEWVASLDISIQYRPQNITNFTCVVFNFNENMNCTWQHPVPYDVTLNDTKVSLVYTTDPQRFSFFVCPQLNFNGCFWNNLTQTGSNQEWFIIEINVTNMNTIDAAIQSQIFKVEPSQNVKPAPVTDLLITNTITKNKFLLSWNQARSQYHQLIFQVFHKLPEEEDFKMIMNNITATNLTYELRPNTMHTFYVQCYPGNGYSGYWSDKTFYSYHTPEQPPSSGPETTNGSYSDLSVSCEGDRRKVMVFWTYVNESARNGVITIYSVKFEGKVLKNVSNDSHSATVEVSCYNKKPVDLEIAAVNSAGESPIPSVVRLAPFSFQVPSKVKESFAIEWNGTNAKAFWNGSDHNMNISYTVFWCIEDTESPCKGPIYWRHVPESQPYLDIPELPSKATDYRFGLAVRDGENASGIQWTDCWFNPQPCKKNFMGKFQEINQIYEKN